MRLIVMIISATILAGCNRLEKVPPKEDPEPSTTRQVIDGFTGRTTVKAGKKAMDTVKEVSKQHQAELDEVTD